MSLYAITVYASIQPALRVAFYMLSGDPIFIGSVASVRLDLQDTDGESYQPDGTIFVEVYSVTDNVPSDTPVVEGPAVAYELEGEPVKGSFLFEFPTEGFATFTQGLVRATIPYGSNSVLYQNQFQLQDPNSLSG